MILEHPLSQWRALLLLLLPLYLLLLTPSLLVHRKTFCVCYRIRLGLSQLPFPGPLPSSLPAHGAHPSRKPLLPLLPSSLFSLAPLPLPPYDHAYPLSRQSCPLCLPL